MFIYVTRLSCAILPSNSTMTARRTPTPVSPVSPVSSLLHPPTSPGTAGGHRSGLDGCLDVVWRLDAPVLRCFALRRVYSVQAYRLLQLYSISNVFPHISHPMGKSKKVSATKKADDAVKSPFPLPPPPPPSIADLRNAVVALAQNFRGGPKPPAHEFFAATSAALESIEKYMAKIPSPSLPPAQPPTDPAYANYLSEHLKIDLPSLPFSVKESEFGHGLFYKGASEGASEGASKGTSTLSLMSIPIPTMLGVDLELSRLSSLPSTPLKLSSVDSTPYTRFLSSLKTSPAIRELHPTAQLSLLLSYITTFSPPDCPHTPYVHSLPRTYSTVSTAFSAEAIKKLNKISPTAYKKALTGRCMLLQNYLVSAKRPAQGAS